MRHKLNVEKLKNFAVAAKTLGTPFDYRKINFGVVSFGDDDDE